MIRIPYEWIETIFGTWVAQHFNDIVAVILALGLLYHLAIRKQRGKGR